MRRILFVSTFLMMATVALNAQVPSSCTPTTPCVAVSWTNSTMAATVTTNAAGVETSGPGTAAVYRCVGTSATCTAAALVGYLASPTTASVWSALTTTLAQTATAATYYDQSIPYGQTLNYALTNTWSGTQGGLASAPSGIFQIAIPSAPTAAPAAPNTPTGILVTSGA